jgi:hypothetical protein
MTDRTLRPLVPVTHADEEIHRRLLAQRSNAMLPKDGTDGMSAPLRLASLTVSDLATAKFAAALWTGAIVYVSNESGGAVPAFSDGTNWRRVTDRAVVS